MKIDQPLVKPTLSPISPLPTRLTPSGALAKPVECLLCDVYGTLFISGSGDISLARLREKQKEGMGALLEKYHIRKSPSQLIEALYTAIRNEHAKAKKQGVEAPEVQIDMVWSKILPIREANQVRAFAVEFELLMNPVWPMPGLKALLDTCRKNGLRLGVISNAQFFTPYLFKWYLGRDLQQLGFDSRLTFFSYKYGWAKPSRYLFDLAAEKLHEIGIHVDRTAYIGNDLRNDVTPAQDVGFQTILFAGDARSLRMHEDDPGYKHVRPDLLITHLDQLASYLI